MTLEAVSLIIGLIIGLLLGFFLAFLLWGKTIFKLKIEKARLETEISKEKEILKEHLENRKSLEETFKSLALDALNSNSKNFVELALQSLKTIEAETQGLLGAKGNEIASRVNEIKELLGKFDRNIREIEIKRETAYTSLEISQKDLAKTTSELLKALKLSKGGGNWGEIQLKRVAELAGMVEHCDYDVQVYTKDNGETYYADMVVRLPENKKIIVDAKTPISAFLKSLDETEKNADEILKEFTKNVYDRVSELSKKEYHKKYDQSVDFVVMFIPSEAMFSTILEKVPSFIEDCTRASIIPASPLNLIGLLKSIAYGWRQNELEIEAKTILGKVKDLYEGLCSSSKHLESLGESLHKAVENYNTFIGSIERNVFSKGREINKLSPDKTIKEMKEVNSVRRELRSQEWKTGDDNK